jgi:hypothetical protein
LQVTLPDALVLWVKTQAVQERRSMSALVQEALERYRTSLRGLRGRGER